ncbi:MAG: cysteine protease [Burkholderiales bacterium]|nr:cysteine protease [Burkholderiales bacterium]
MIFHNPAGAPELACDECGCRWFDRMANRCYECGADVPEASRAAFEQALAAFRADRDPDRANPDAARFTKARP